MDISNIGEQAVHGVEGKVAELTGNSGGFIQKIKDLGPGAFWIILIGIVAQLLCPWWSIVVVAFYVALILGRSSGESYAFGFAAVSLLWLSYAGFLNNLNGGVLSGKVAGFFKLSGPQLLALTSTIAGLVGGFGAMLGSMTKDMWRHYRNV
jgi:hypothetical protein